MLTFDTIEDRDTWLEDFFHVASPNAAIRFNREQMGAAGLFQTGNYADQPDTPYADMLSIVVGQCRSITPGRMVALTAIPANWIKSRLRRGGRRAQSNRKVLDVQTLPDGPAYHDRLSVAGMTDKELAHLAGGVGMSVGDSETPLSFYDDDL